ncbi:MAG: Serine/threonine-protein kinase PknD [Steroidobacteraceae bacterium]|nr:Serine/threonine-protein kinase PknD [Steroidobacteraceae bacterium]
MRLLLVDHDPRYRALIRHHVTCRWPDADVVTYNPVRRGPVAPEFLAQGFDAVLLDCDSPRGAGFGWLEDLGSRPGFAPVIFFAPDDELATRERAIEAGAFDTFDRASIDNSRFLDALERASNAHLEALSAWRGSDEGYDARQFGAARLTGYRRIRELARGSVSDLYLAESEAVGELVVLKVTHALRKANGVDQSFDRFLQEYEIVRRLRHPNVVRIHDLGVMDDFAFIVMEYFAGGDLRRRMRSPVTLREALEFALEIARALTAVHDAGVRHRDLKPGNVMVRDDGSIALIDFGLAKHEALAFEITDTGMIFGTPHYMSPEQGHGQPTDERSDLYSLGVMLYEMLARSKPYDADNPMAIIYLHAKAPVPRLPAEFARAQPIVDRLMAKEPAARLANAQEAAAILEMAIEELESP